MEFSKATPDSKQSECGKFWIKRIHGAGQTFYESWAEGRNIGSFPTTREAVAMCERHELNEQPGRF